MTTTFDQQPGASASGTTKERSMTNLNKVALARIIDELQARGLSQDISIEGIFNGKVPN